MHFVPRPTLALLAAVRVHRFYPARTDEVPLMLIDRCIKSRTIGEDAAVLQPHCEFSSLTRSITSPCTVTIWPIHFRDLG